MSDLIKPIAVILNALLVAVLGILFLTGEMSVSPRTETGMIILLMIMFAAPISALIQILRKPN